MTTSATTTTARPISAVRRFSQVYVDLPPSPYGRASPTSRQSLSTPFALHNNARMAIPDSLPVAAKRKRSPDDTSTYGLAIATKKQKVDAGAQDKATTIVPKGAIVADSAPQAAVVSESAVKGYCHQCSRQYPAPDFVQCTFSGHKGTQCNAKYCKPCLRNRYEIDMDSVTNRGLSGLKSRDLEGHTASSYVFKCPRCSGTCNCRYCRKQQGLPPTGVDTKGKGKAPFMARPAVKAPNVHKPKPPPRVHWARVPVPSSFTLEHALQRVHIHDFVLRFASLFDLSRAQLDELAEIGGRRLDEDDGPEEGEDPSVAVGWVKETCLRTLISGLLSIIQGSEELKGSKEAQAALSDAVRATKAKWTNVNLTRLWTSLAGLRSFFDLPGPLPPPTGTRGHLTRSGAQLGADGVQITSAAQLVPVIAALIEPALSSPRIREELEAGLKLAKDLSREEREQAKAEKERWNMWRSVQGNVSTKAEREKHKRKLASYQSALQVALQDSTLRFVPLGTDPIGRWFVATAPSAAEREAAAALLAGDMHHDGKARSRNFVSVNERKSLRRWDWFVAVYGKRPPDPLILPPDLDANSGDSSDSDENQGEEGRWWGFWEPVEIRRLANWVAHVNGLQDPPELRPGAPTEGTSSFNGPTKRRSAVGSRSTSATAVVMNSPGPLSTESESEALTPLTDSSLADRDMLSPLTSYDEDRDEARQGMYRQRVSRKETMQLVRNLREYADVLEWRAWRMEPDEDTISYDGKDNATAV
ncbi:hypothetical protein K488DRAFT_53426 [Vararia minispora EC-137]|uniref:Uncharacterized protein n=1 Tax=Vararia minispora EC-137 TaxID=1314806 RepID=A0ACB8QG44_9AGAM|nr:hypothetical protein K488DRAFT_53426 [Vararia minispora EC-137]